MSPAHSALLTHHHASAMEKLKLHLEASSGGRGGGADAFAVVARSLVGAAIAQYDAGVEGEQGCVCPPLCHSLMSSESVLSEGNTKTRTLIFAGDICKKLVGSRGFLGFFFFLEVVAYFGVRSFSADSHSVITNANTHRAAERLQPYFLAHAKLVIPKLVIPNFVVLQTHMWRAAGGMRPKPAAS